MSDANRKPPMDAAESETLRMRGNSLHGNRETLETPSPHRRGTVRKGILPHTGHARFQGVGRSHSTRRSGRTKPARRRRRSPWREGDRPRETPLKPYSRRTQSRESVASDCGAYEKLQSGIRKCGLPPCCTMSRPELLRASYFALKRSAAPGVDGMTWHEYGRDLEERIADLHDRVHRGAYWAQPSKRAWIPKADGRQRPLGIAALEDKIVQQAVKTVLEQIYEEDFLGFSYGFRPGRSCHNAWMRCGWASRIAR